MTLHFGLFLILHFNCDVNLETWICNIFVIHDCKPNETCPQQACKHYYFASLLQSWNLKSQSLWITIANRRILKWPLWSNTLFRQQNGSIKMHMVCSSSYWMTNQHLEIGRHETVLITYIGRLLVALLHIECWNLISIICSAPVWFRISIPDSIYKPMTCRSQL